MAHAIDTLCARTHRARKVRAPRARIAEIPAISKSRPHPGLIACINQSINHFISVTRNISAQPPLAYESQ